ncbi:alpha/beta fold hydrolase [Aquimarina muelleri]|uniref:alpha/beta fold hydrolase n=1 Tax=Aquimarina muelleri TaxID=279356 RepID=UPI003F687BEE
MKYLYIVLIVLLCYNVKGQNVKFEKAESFYPNSESLKQKNIIWGHLIVPENWQDINSAKIKIAVSVLKNSSNKSDADAVVFIQGGPGASGIQNVRSWRNHPLRKKNDIVLMDIRGTGFSEPRLCPDLGSKFLEILAKNQSEEEDEKQKTIAALSCKQDLINKGIDIEVYNSLSISKDLNALKKQLGYENWNVYGVSYGTYIAQVYASTFSDDIKALVLDSSVSDITTYYTKNTSNYISSLSKVFEKCKNNEACNSQYPELENVYYKTIADLEDHPITVSVDKETIKSGEFTYNSEDFKIAVQQALYNKQLIEVIPLLIYQFQERNADALGNLVSAFSNLLGMDYGVYYCVSCNEVLPNNNISEYEKDVSKYDKIGGGVSFYKSDFRVCDQWNLNRKDSIVNHDLSKLEDFSFPVMVFSGEYDPITPSANGKEVAKRFKKANVINGLTYGHVPSFTKIGKEVADSFINNPFQKPDFQAFKNVKKVNFVSDITINSGVAKIGNSLSQFDPIFMAPLFIALIVMIVFVFTYTIRLVKRKYNTNSDKIIRGFGILTSIIGIVGLISLVLALIKISGTNYFVLAFGLTSNFSYVFTLIITFVILLVVTILYFIISIKRIQDRSIVFSLLFSNVLLVTYMFYWGII